MEKLLHHPCNTLRAKSFEVMMRQRIRKIIDEIKPEAVDVNGVEDMLRHLLVYINVNDYERIKCLLINSGRIAAWDELFDVLKTCDEKAFEKYVSLILSHRSKAPGDVKEIVKEVCRRNGLEMLCREQSDCGGSITYNKLRTGSCQSKDSFESGSSFESIDQDDTTVNHKRERFASSGSKGSEEHSKSTTSIESYDANTVLDTKSPISAMPEKLRRELGCLLDPKDPFDKNWHRLAECLPLEHNEIRKIEELDKKTYVVLEHMDYHLMTIGSLIEKLYEIGRFDCVQLIEEAGVDLRPDLAEHLQKMRSDQNSRNGKSIEKDTADEKHSPRILQETTVSSDSEAFKSHQKAPHGKVRVNADKYVDNCSYKDVQRLEATSQHRIESDVRSTQEIEEMTNCFGYQRSKSMPETRSHEDISHYLTKTTKATSFDKEKLAYSSHKIPEKDSDCELCHTEALPFQSMSFTHNLDGGVMCQETEDPKGVTESKLDSIDSKPEIVEEHIHLEKEDPSYNSNADLMGTMGTGQSMALPKQDSRESVPHMKEPPEEYVHYTLPVMRPTNQANIQIPSITRGDGVKLKIDTNSLKDSQGADLVQTIVGSSPPTPCSPKTEKAWMESENFKKQLDLPCNSSQPLYTTDESCFGSQKTLENTNDERRNELTNSGIGVSETKVAFEVNEESNYSSKGFKPDVITDYPMLSPQAQYSASYIKSPHQELNRLSLENKTSNSVSSAFTSMISSFFEKMGFGRRPVVPHRAERAQECASVLITQPSSLRRQVSTNNAVPTEHSEFHAEGFGDTDCKMMTMKSPSEHVSKTKKTERPRRSSEHLIGKGRFALLINNCSYTNLPELPPKNFTDSLGVELEQCGWQVEIQSNLSNQNMENAIEDFRDRSKNSIAFFYYFGHSVQIRGENYILPVDIESQAVKTKTRLKKYAINLEFIRSQMTAAKASVILLDAGRVLSALTEKQGFAAVQERQYQCVLFTSSSLSNGFIADLLGRRLRDNEAIKSVKEWIAPFRNYFEAFAVSRRLLPLPIKVPDGEWNKKLLDYSNNEVKWVALFSKANGDLQIGKLDGNWLVNLNTDSSDLELDFNIFLKTADDENLACYLFYYEGPVEMDNGELLLKQTSSTNLEEPPTLTMILEMLAETVLGPRVIIINATESNFDINDFNANEYNLQETLFMISASYNESKQSFYNDFIATLKQENIDFEHELLKLCNNFNFEIFKCSLFNI